MAENVDRPGIVLHVMGLKTMSGTQPRNTDCRYYAVMQAPMVRSVGGRAPRAGPDPLRFGEL